MWFLIRSSGFLFSVFVPLCVEESSSDELCHNIALRALLWAPVTPVRPALLTPPWQGWGWMASWGPSSPSRSAILCGIVHLIATAVPAQLKTLVHPLLVVLTGADVSGIPLSGQCCPSLLPSEMQQRYGAPGYSSDSQPVAKHGKPSITIIFLSFFHILTQRENKITSDGSLSLWSKIFRISQISLVLGSFSFVIQLLLLEWWHQ